MLAMPHLPKSRDLWSFPQGERKSPPECDRHQCPTPSNNSLTLEGEKSLQRFAHLAQTHTAVGDKS